MAWTTRVLQVLEEYKNKEGTLKHRWEITRVENDDGKHMDECLQKTSYYVKDGVAKRGYPQALNKYDMRWIRNNWSKISEALDPAPGESAPSSNTAKNPEQDDIEETPF